MRPAPKIALSDYNKDTHKVFEVIKQSSLYGVTFEGQPITTRTGHKLLDGQRIYHRSVYPDKGRALTCAEKLNKRFKTDKFQVFALDIGEHVAKEVVEPSPKRRHKGTSKGTSES